MKAGRWVAPAYKQAAGGATVVEAATRPEASGFSRKKKTSATGSVRFVRTVARAFGAGLWGIDFRGPGSGI